MGFLTDLFFELTTAAVKHNTGDATTPTISGIIFDVAERLRPFSDRVAAVAASGSAADIATHLNSASLIEQLDKTMDGIEEQVGALHVKSFPDYLHDHPSEVTKIPLAVRDLGAVTLPIMNAARKASADGHKGVSFVARIQRMLNMFGVADGSSNNIIATWSKFTHP